MLFRSCSSKGSDYEGHGFFEASSLRKINDKYYFIYSAEKGHELCYATCDSPDGTFKYGGVLVSIGDVGPNGIKGVKDANNFCGNTHGSILTIGDKHYIFYHRQTNRHCFSRQACAEEIFMDDNGNFAQVEVTSSGLNISPLEGKGEYGAYIACILKCKKGGAFYMPIKCGGRPYFTQTGKDRENNPDQHIADISDGTTVGFKYFNLSETSSVGVKVKGSGSGKFIISQCENGEQIAVIDVQKSEDYKSYTAQLKQVADSKSALYLSYKGKGKIDLMSIILG